jgi:hypothetical protein
MPIIKEDGLLHQREIEEMDNSTYEGRVFKRPATPVRRPSREIRREIERHQDSKRDLQKGSRVISQQGNEHSLPQDSRTGSQQRGSRTGSQQENGHSLPQESRIIEKVPPSARSGNQQAKRQSQKKPNQSV